MRAMKDSGIEWIGEIPQEWDVRRIKFTLDAHSGGAWGTNEGEDEADIICVRVADFDYSQLTVDFHDKMTVRSYSAKTITESSIRSGDILLEKSGGGETTPVGRSVLFESNEPMMCANFIEWLRPNRSFDSRFLNYWLAAAYINGFSKRNVKQTTGIQNLDVPAFLSERIASPNVAIQVSIADYLEKKCAEIDAIIAAKEKTNELLKERRQSIIYEAVTKGLDPTVPMKDSGVEWIGEIPESWSVWRLKHLLCQEKGAIKAGPFGSSITANDMQGGDVKVFTQRTVLDNDFLSGDEYISFDKYEDLKGFSVKTGDILITTRGTIGKTAIVPKNSFGILHPCLIKMSIDSDTINKSLLCRIFNETNIFEEQLRLASNATTIDVIYTQNLLNIFVPLAPLHEQDRICKYLNEKCESLDYLISSNDSTIKKLKEYRQSVIYEAVTGKVEI